MTMWYQHMLMHCLALSALFATVSTHRKTVTVKNGRTIFLQSTDLGIQVPKGEVCKVEVIYTDPMSQRVGKLEPQVFECAFASDTVKYTHLGSPLLKQDEVKLLVHHLKNTTTTTELLSLTVNIQQAPYSIFLHDNRLRAVEVRKFFGLSNPIDASVLRFRYNFYSGANCIVSFSQLESSMPMLGQIVQGKLNRPRPALRTDCRGFLYMGLRYKHLSPPTPQTDYLPLKVEVYEPTKSKGKPIVEHLYLPIKIYGAFPNMAPKASFMSTYMMQVDQFMLTPLDPTILSASDSETSAERLVFNLTKPPPHGKGYFVHLQDHTRPITSFLQSDLMNHQIAFQPPNVTTTEKQAIEVQFTIYDSYFTPSKPITLHIIVRPSNSPTPHVIINSPLILLEGQSRPITTAHLQIADNEDKDLQIYVKGGLRHGRLKIAGQASALSFGAKDLEQGKVVYFHDDSDSLKDSINLGISNGRSSVQVKFPINIIPKDDSPPYLTNNIGIKVTEGGTTKVSSDVISAHDRDSDDDKIVFRIVKPPKAGRLLRKYRPTGMGQSIKNFLQSEMAQGYIYYQHLGGEVFTDFFDFRLEDDHEPPNKSGRYNVIVRATPVKDMPPQLVHGSTKSLEVRESDLAMITKQNLQYSDVESKNIDIVYTITSQPFFLTTAITLDAGHITSLENVTMLMKSDALPVIHKFTQSDINHKRVAYVPPGDDIGPNRRHVRFVYTVSDPKGNKVMDQSFDITILPVNNQRPVLSVSKLRVQEGGGLRISTSHISAYDPDTNQDHLKFFLKEEPHFGKLLMREVQMKPGDQFRLADLLQSTLRYVHDGSEVANDKFRLTVSDGLHSVTRMVHIDIEPVDDEWPWLLPSRQHKLVLPEGGQAIITPAILSAKDNDTEDSKLRFDVIHLPKMGVIQRGHQRVSNFVQHDIGRHLIKFVHTSGEIGPEPIRDFVTFAVTDRGTHLDDRNSVRRVNITILPVNNRVPTITLAKPLQVKEGGTTPITVQDLSAEDPDTPIQDLKFVIIKPAQWGFVENTKPDPGSEKSNAGESVSSFYWNDLRDGTVNYVQSRHEGMEPLQDSLVVHVTDGTLKSRPRTLKVSIIPQNDEVPVLQVHNITVAEGSDIMIGTNVVEAEDRDLPKDKIMLSVSRPPKHGTMSLIRFYNDQSGRRKEEALREVSMEELSYHLQLRYTHDGSEKYVDNFMLQVSDSKHVVQELCWVSIMPVNDEPPQILKNAGLHVQAGRAGLISSIVLESADVDSQASDVYFILDSVPSKGIIQYHKDPIPVGKPEGIVLPQRDEVPQSDTQWRAIALSMNFSQTDINNNRVRYLHTGGADNTGTDKFTFHVTDGINTKPRQTFEIEVLNSKKGDIVITIHSMTVKEGGKGILSTTVLSATDGSQQPEELVFYIVTPPQGGKLVFQNDGDKSVKKFTLLDLAANRLLYKHTGKTYMHQDSFVFRVNNGVETSKDVTFVIEIEEKDKALPTLAVNVPLTVIEGGEVMLTSSNLLISDPDTDPQDLLFILSKPPQHGALFLMKEKIESNFTQADVDKKLIQYKNGGSGPGTDHFLFNVTDKRHQGYLINGTQQTKPALFNILVQTLPQNPPKMLVNKKPDALQNLGKGSYGYILTDKHLKAAHPKLKSSELVYMITRRPQFGQLENSVTGRLIRRKFTQQDLDEGNVRYVLEEGTTKTNDSFVFRLRGSNRNILDNQRFEMSWPSLEFDLPQYIVCENAGKFSVKLVRTGDVQQSTFVDIKVKDVSAKQDKDYVISHPGQIQFDAGVSVGTWELQVKQDSHKEHNEKFRLILKNPVNAVLGSRRKTAVHIINADKGKCAEYIGMISRDQTSGKPPLEPDVKPVKVAPHATSSTDKKDRDILPTKFHVFSSSKKSKGKNKNNKKSKNKGKGKSKSRKESKRRRSSKKRSSSKRWNRHRNRQGDSGAVNVIPVTTATPLKGAQACTVDTYDLLYFDMMSQQMYRCTSNGWSPWSRNSKDYGSLVKELAVSSAPTKRSKIDRAKNKRRKCPKGWTKRRKYCYYVFNEKLSWLAAEMRCHRYQGHLLHIDSGWQQRWLQKEAAGQPVWIGLTDKKMPGRWEYVGAQPVTFTKWRSGYPKKSHFASSNNCVMVMPQGDWINRSCDKTTAKFACATVRRKKPWSSA